MLLEIRGMSFQLISALLRGRWLMDKGYAQSYMPAVVRLLAGEEVSFGWRDNKMFDDDDNDSSKTPQLRLRTYAGSAYTVRPYSDITRLPQNSIAVVSLTGPLMKFGGACSYGMVDHAGLINRLANAGNVAGIILDIDSPGGQADGTAMTADTISRASQKKPIISIVDDGMAASAAAWIASAGQEVYVTQPTDQYGSVGVYTTIADWNAHYQDYYKLPVREIYAPQSTDKNLDYRQALAGNDDLVKADLKVLADQFIKTVKRNRRGKLKGNDWQTGKMFYADEALKLGLIDGIKSFEQVIDRMNKLINK